MKIMMAMMTLDDQEHQLDVFGVLRVTQTLAKMLLSRKLLMELAGALYTDYFVMEFTEGSLKVVGDVLESFQSEAYQIASDGEWEKISDLPACPGRQQLKIGWSVVRLTKDGFWWVVDVASEDGDLGAGGWERARTCRLPWDLVTQAAGEFDPAQEVSNGSFLVHWETEEK